MFGLLGGPSSGFASATADADLTTAGTTIVTTFAENIKAFFTTNIAAIAGVVIFSFVILFAIRFVKRAIGGR